MADGVGARWRFGVISLMTAMTMAVGQPAFANVTDQTMLGELPERFGPDLSPQSFGDEQRALASAVSDYLSGGYCIAGQRSIAFPAGNIQWAAISKAAGGDIEFLLHGYRIRPDGYNPGYDLIATWAMQDAPGTLIALAALENALPGRKHLLSYFELRKVSDVVAAGKPCSAGQPAHSEGQAPPVLADLPPPDGRRITPRAADRMRMVEVLNARVQGRYRIGAERYFKMRGTRSTFGVTGRPGAFLKRHHGAAFEAAIADSQSGSRVSATLWCLDDRPHPCFAAAVLESSSDTHNNLIGYFEIRRDMKTEARRGPRETGHQPTWR